MSTFRLYLELGISHIANFKGYDHILFIIALCAVYLFRQWRQVLLLITAFTLGHTCTLALSTLNIIQVSARWIEFLIPLTIFMTALGNIINRNTEAKDSVWRFKYATALFFGLIHGLGFSSYLRGLLGNESDLIKPLFAFNLGIEIGQLMIVIGVLLITHVLITIVKVSRKNWNRILSVTTMVIAILLMIQRLPW